MKPRRRNSSRWEVGREDRARSRLLLETWKRVWSLWGMIPRQALKVLGRGRQVAVLLRNNKGNMFLEAFHYEEKRNVCRGCSKLHLHNDDTQIFWDKGGGGFL